MMDVAAIVKETALEMAKTVGPSAIHNKAIEIRQQHADINTPSSNQCHVTDNNCQLSMPQLLTILRQFCYCDSTIMPPKEIIAMVLENLGDAKLTEQCASMDVLQSARHVVTRGLGLGIGE